MADDAVDLSPETIAGTIIDTQEALLAGQTPNADQIRACKLANASESLLSTLHRLLHAIPPQKDGSSALWKAAREALELLDSLPKPRNG